MSVIQDLGKQIAALVSDAGASATGLYNMANGLRKTTDAVQRLMQGTGQRNYQEIIARLSEAQKKIADAAAVLAAASQGGKSWLDGNVGGNSGSAWTASADGAGSAEAQGAAADEAEKGFSRHFSPEEVAERWKAGVESIEEQIANYKEALMDRGVPECKWLDQTLAEHMAAMLEQEGYDLDVASGHGGDTAHNGNAYRYPGHYPPFYDALAAQFARHCLEGTNPNYQHAPEWVDNCQRCVPACEMRRRGFDVTVQPSTYGSSHLPHRPFDVWEGAEVLTGTGSGAGAVQNSMASWGDGARAQVVVFWDSPLGGGHTFMAEQRNGTTVFFDPQTGNPDCAGYFDRVIDGGTLYCRIDNLPFSPYIEECYREVV